MRLRNGTVGPESKRMIDSCPVFDLFRQPTATPEDPAVVRRRQILLSAAVAALLAGPHA